MRFNLRKGLIFTLQFVLLFFAFLWLYTETRPAYHMAVLNGTNPLLERFSPPMQIEIGPQEWRVYILTANGEWLLLFTIPSDYLELFYFSIVFLPALILATPLGFGRRLLLLSWGLPLLFIVHVLSTAGYFRAEFCFYLNPDNFLCNWLASFLSTGNQVFAIAIWGLLTWRYWFGKSVAS